MFFAFGGLSLRELAYPTSATAFARHFSWPEPPGGYGARLIHAAGIHRRHPSDQGALPARHRLVGVPPLNEEVLRNDLLMRCSATADLRIVLFTYRFRSWRRDSRSCRCARQRHRNAYMGWRNVGINLQTLRVITIAIGFGIDYALYIVSALSRSWNRGEPGGAGGRPGAFEPPARRDVHGRLPRPLPPSPGLLRHPLQR